MPSIVVVGNGPSVLDNKLGELIDSFDEVVRINHYIPMKEYSGEKVTIYCTSTWATKFYQEIPKLAKEILIWDEIACKKCVYDKFAQTKYIDTTHIKKYLETTHGFKTHPKAPWASTGISLLMYLIQENKFDKIFIVGFDNLKRNTQRHYFDNKDFIGISTHSSDLEKKFIDYYIEKGILVKL
jgi:hypothetical protein